MPSHTCRIALVSCALACLLACASSSSAPGTVQAPVDLKIAKIADLKASGIATNGQNEKNVECTLWLTATHITKSSPGCYLDGHLTEGGQLHFPCDGSGHAEAAFGEQRYVGDIAKGELRIESITELDWEDNCHWSTTAIITGSIPIRGAVSLGSAPHLQWSYADRVLSGSQCSGACTARAVVTMSQTRSAPPPQADDDDDSDVDP